jgi:hypothetical protein
MEFVEGRNLREILENGALPHGGHLAPRRHSENVIVSDEGSPGEEPFSSAGSWSSTLGKGRAFASSLVNPLAGDLESDASLRDG